MVSVGARVKIAGILSVVKANIFRFFILSLYENTEAVDKLPKRN